MKQQYERFIGNLRRVGFSPAMGPSLGVFSIVPCAGELPVPDFTREGKSLSEIRDDPFAWGDYDPKANGIILYSNSNVDPYTWRYRVLNQETGISLSKCFLGHMGYIDRSFIPYFLAARRQGMEFEDEYNAGTASLLAKKAFDAISVKPLPTYAIYQEMGLQKKETSKVDRALAALQEKLYITVSGYKNKPDEHGIPTGRDFSVYCTTEEFWGKEPFYESTYCSKEEAADKIRHRILELNPDADAKTVTKFIGARKS
ncbi:MAG: hypothetical protein LBC41_07260 [Clostridiales bacterium]|jgi:hypothetical protein|nr:hypothetical protein [Clostridiales bacterium]